jgi:hypothetical protein
MKFKKQEGKIFGDKLFLTLPIKDKSIFKKIQVFF